MGYLFATLGVGCKGTSATDQKMVMAAKEKCVFYSPKWFGDVLKPWRVLLHKSASVPSQIGRNLTDSLNGSLVPTCTKNSLALTCRLDH